MQIRIEARLIWNINTSLSESAMKASPQRISCHFLELFLDAMQDRGSGTPMESLCVGWCWLGPGGDLKARQQVARECPCFPGLWVTRPLSNPTWTHWFIIGGGILIQHLFGILTIGGCGVLCFSSISSVGHEVSFVCSNTLQLPEGLSQARKPRSCWVHGTWIRRSHVDSLTMFLFRVGGNSSL